jgi:hypothetical protein
MTYYVNPNSDEVKLPATPTKDGKVRGGDPEGGRVLVLVLNHLGESPSVMEVGGIISKFFFNPSNLKKTLTIIPATGPQPKTGHFSKQKTHSALSLCFLTVLSRSALSVLCHCALSGCALSLCSLTVLSPVVYCRG